MEQEIRPIEGRLKRIVLAYIPVAVIGAIATFAYDVGAHPDSSARDDIVFRGSPLVPPLLCRSLSWAPATWPSNEERVASSRRP